MNIYDIAKEAGVSISTVSRVMNHKDNVNPATRQKVEEVLEKGGRRPVPRATGAQSGAMDGRMRRVAVLTVDIRVPHYARTAYTIERECSRRGYETILCNTGGEFQETVRYLQAVVEKQVDGIILVPSGPESYEKLRPYLSRLPTVFVGENLREVPESYVSVDNYRGAYMGVEYLYGLGHRDILYFGRRRGSTTHQLRSEGYAAACQDLGLTPQYCNNTFPLTSIKYGYQLAKQLFAQERNFSAIFAATDTNALGVIQAAEESGICIPEDISLLGFDNIRYSSLPRIHLTTIEQPMKMLASVAVDSLLDKIQSELAGYTHRILTPTLIERSTCRAVD